MAAQYTKFALEDIQKFLRRGFRAMRPRQGEDREIYFDLKLSSKAFIRVWSSIYAGETTVRGKERRPMRVQFLSGTILGKGRPLTRGKAPIVKRTQNWRTSLQNRIQDYIELFNGGTYDKYHDDFDDDDEEVMAPARPEPEPEEKSTEVPGEPPQGDEPRRPSFTGPPITGPQVNFVMKLINALTKTNKLDLVAPRFGFDSGPISEEDVKMTLSKSSASRFIDAAKSTLGWDRGGGGGGGYGRSRYRRRYADGEEGFDFEDEVVEETTTASAPSYSYDRS